MADIVLEARGVVKTYGIGAAASRVLRGLDLSVRAGEFTVVLGPSGSGKSTLLNVLGLMDKPDGGEILFSGRKTSGLPETERARLRNQKIGFVFQFDSLLPEFTILENVTMPTRIAGGDSEARALKLLEGFGLAGLCQRFPYQVSGGERQRAALCRALINRPAVLLADEPTGNLDKANGEMVFTDLKALAAGQDAAVVMVTHNESAANFATRVLHMQDGCILKEPA